ncbi:MAG: putative bifunctional diguanylate cyclase/phosphodiesterase [Acidobacteriota bacterium]
MNLPQNAESRQQCEILDALPALVFLERAGRIVFANAEALEVMGLGGARWIPRNTEEVLWGLFPGIAEPQTALAGSRGGSPFHATLAGRGGRIIPVEGTYSILNTDLREGIIVAQVSSRERAPKPRLMEDVLASLPEAVAIVHGGRVLYVNESFIRMFEYTEEEAIGRNLRDLIVPETRQHENAMLQRTMEDHGRVSVETVRMKKSGELVDVAMQVARLMVNGAEAGFVLTYRDIADRKQLEAQLQQDAMYDVLTGLPNRALFEDRLKLALSRRTRRHEQNCGVLLLDLDQFAGINSAIGHAAGDMLLMTAAGRLRGTLRPQDTAARLGGDHFAILVESIQGTADLEVVAQRVHRELDRTYDLLGHRIQAPVSMGMAISADDRNTPEAMLRDADMALQSAKQAGGAGYRVFDCGPTLQISADTQRERQLRQLLDQREFELWYQPIIRLATGVVEGFEAMPRRRCADGSIDTLHDLFTVAEDTGFILRVGRETTEMVCQRLKAWNGILAGTGLFLSLDVTRRQFHQDDLVAQVQSILAASGVDPARLMLEVAENAVSENPDRATAILQRLVDCGVRVALDHFGAGLAPLNQLLRLPVEVVKLDAKLTQLAAEPDRRLALLESLVHVAKSAGVQLLALGVQSDQQLQVLRELGCELGQGPSFSVALEPESARQLAGTSGRSLALNA